MQRRTVVIFWAAVAAAVFLLGGTVASARTLGDGGGPGEAMLLVVSIAGVAVALVVVGRIAFVVGRSRRRQRGSQRG
jgi:hypothetical protein